MPDEQLVSATVARGRTVHVPTGEKITIGKDNDGKLITRMQHRAAGPGETVKLPADEVKRLRQHGFLVDPEAVAAAAKIAEQGPGVTVQGDVSAAKAG